MDNYISIHHSAPMRDEWTYYKKGKVYTRKEYYKLIRRRQQIKDAIFTILFGVFIIFRAYVFLKYNI